VGLEAARFSAHYTVKKDTSVTLALLLLLAASAGFEESFRAGLLALQRNDLNVAETELGAAAKLEPNNGRVWVALARTYWKLKDAGKANDAALKAAALAGSDPLVLSTLAIYYSDSGQTLKAAEAQARYAVAVPRDTAAREKADSLYFEATQPLLQQEKFAEAIAILSEARGRLKNSAQLELALGVAYYGLRRFDDAAGAFLRTIAIAPDVDQPYTFLGRFLDQIPGRLPEVMQQFVNYERANPSKSLGYLLHAKALNAQSIEPEAAQTLLQKAISLDDRDASAHFELGSVFDRTQRYQDAEREFQRAAGLDSVNPATHYRLARIYDRLGKTEAARAERELHTKLVEAQQAAR
jgi:tetratricopeptide (TPR) repeat protein